MAQKNRTDLKAYFETGDVPTQAEFADLIDSQYNITDDTIEAHASSHQSGGGDAIKLDDLAVPDDNTDLDFSTSAHGLVPKGTDVGNFLKDDGTWASAGGTTNTELITADKTLVVTDAKYQILSGVNKSVILPTSPPDGTVFYIKNNNLYNSSNYLIIKNSDGIVIDYLYTTSINGYVWQGSYWRGLYWATDNSDIAGAEQNTCFGFYARGESKGTVFGKNTKGQINGAGFGYSANGGNNGAAVGYSSDAEAYGAAVGYGAKGKTYGVGVGYGADGEAYGVSIGYQSGTNSKRYSTAIGNYSETERWGELSINIDAETDQENNHGLIGLTLQTTNATPAIMLCAGASLQRILIRPSSAFAFDLKVVARDNVTGEVGSWTVVNGLIKRDASNNTTLVGATVTEDYDESSDWAVAVTADDTNEALQIEVTGDATNPVQWAASIKYVETHF